MSDRHTEVYESVIESEEDYVYSYLGQAVGVVSWKRFAVVADASNAVGFTRYLANDFSFTPVLVVISEPVFRPEDIEDSSSDSKNASSVLYPRNFAITGFFINSFGF